MSFVRGQESGWNCPCAGRTSHYLIARKVEACAAEPVAERLQQTLRKLPAAKRRSLTVDNGREFARPIELEKKLDVPIYFAHPYHAWERAPTKTPTASYASTCPKAPT